MRCRSWSRVWAGAASLGSLGSGVSKTIVSPSRGRGAKNTVKKLYSLFIFMQSVDRRDIGAEVPSSSSELGTFFGLGTNRQHLEHSFPCPPSGKLHFIS